MRFNRLGLAVADQERSRQFSAHWFGFDAGPAQRYPDGVRVIRNAAGFDVALENATEATRPRFLHFGFRVDGRDAVHELARMRAGGPDGEIEIVETEDDPAYTGCKCLDPDGYTVKVYWEP